MKCTIGGKLKQAKKIKCTLIRGGTAELYKFTGVTPPDQVTLRIWSFLDLVTLYHNVWFGSELQKRKGKQFELAYLGHFRPLSRLNEI